MTAELLEQDRQTGFVRQLEDTGLSVVTDLQVDSDRLLIAFGGLKGFRAIPPLEFSTITRDMPTKKIFLRDFRQAWYQGGLLGVAEDVDSIASYLHAHIREQRVSQVVTIGNSMGGYAALLFGAMLNAQAAIAIAPQTFLGFWRRLSCGDVRWLSQMQQARRANRNPLYLNLRHYFARHPGRDGKFYVYYSGYFDALHAWNLKGLGVELRYTPGSGHDLVRKMRETGQLKKIILDNLVPSA